MPSWTSGLPGGPGWVGRPSRRSVIGQKDIPKFLEAILDVREGSADLSEGPGWVERPFRRSGTGREAFPEVWIRLGGHPEGPEGVGMPTRRSGAGSEVWEAILKVQEG